MYRKLSIVACLALAVGLVITSATHAGKFNRVVDIGEKAPGFEAVAGIDGKYHSLRDYKKAKVVVLCFTCNHCPVAVAYEQRFVEFTKEYTDKGIAFVAINVQNLEEDRLDKMRERAQRAGFNFDYLFDPSQAVGRAYGATVTPHLFVLDEDRKIAYMGRFDDSLNSKKVEHQYVRDAVDALLAGSKVEVKETRQFGCNIQYERKKKVTLKVVDKTGFDAALKKHRGKVVFVDFWGSWCLNCLKNFPHTIELHRKYQDDGLRVVTLAMEFEPDEENTAALKRLKQLGATCENLVSDEPVEDAVDTFGISGDGLPEYWLIGRNGKLIRKFTNEDPDNPIDPKEIDAAVRKALGLGQADKQAD